MFEAEIVDSEGWGMQDASEKFLFETEVVDSANTFAENYNSGSNEVIDSACIDGEESSILIVSDQFDCMNNAETLQETSFERQDFHREMLLSKSPHFYEHDHDDIYDNDSFMSDSSASSSDCESVDEDPFFDAVEDDHIDNSEEDTMTVRQQTVFEMFNTSTISQT